MNTHCLECGAPLTCDDGCAQRFYHFIGLEMTDPEYGAVHHLTVTDYATPAQYRKDIKTWARLVLEDAAQIREQVWP